MPIGPSHRCSSFLCRLATVTRIQPLLPHLSKPRLRQLDRLPNLDGVLQVAIPSAELKASPRERLLAIFAVPIVQALCSLVRLLRRTKPSARPLKYVWYFDLAQLRGVRRSDAHHWLSQFRHNLVGQVINAADGAVYNFGYNGSNQLSWVQYNAVVAPLFTDASGTNTYPGPSGIVVARTVNFTYSSTTTAVVDTDLHSVTYTHDGIGRVTQTQAQTGSTALTTSQGWDGANDLAYSRDARGNETDYAYDSMGNAIAVGQPATYLNVGGSNVWMRATSLYSYDSSNNITAYCDPVWSHQNGRDWTSPPAPSDALCPNQSGTTRYTWTPPSSGAEPYGELTQMVTPLGDNTVTFSYNPSSQGGTDYGLPTSVTGTGFTQNDGTNITPQQSFIYDSHGNLVCYNKGAGWSVLQYDGLNRTTAIGDPDDNALSGAICGKTTGKYATASYTTYYPNGEVKTTQSPSEVAAGVATSFTYDADGNQASITKHFGGTAGITNKYYDGLERLVEVQQPQDPTDEVTNVPWLTRYFYDLTAGGTVSIVYGPSFKAYGNLYKSQEWMGSYSGWVDMGGTSYDALDRVIAKYAYPPNSGNTNCQAFGSFSSCTTAPTAKTNTYDAAADSVGLLTRVTDALGETTSFNYDSVC